MLRYTLVFLLPLALLFSCKQKQDPAITGNTDPHSHLNLSGPIVTHLDLQLQVDFKKELLIGKASWIIKNEGQSTAIIFDDAGLNIAKVTLGENEKETTFEVGKSIKFIGSALKVTITKETKIVNIYYSTDKNAAALQWLNPQQTAGKKYPYLFTQSESIAARSWIPCQDSPGIRFTYNATVTVPKDLLALMSAENPQAKNNTGVYKFKQTHPIASYMLALAVGNIVFKAVDDRTGIYTEPSLLDKASYEFADLSKMVHTAEKLYGAYRWGRYDLLVLPPSFPFGGMENPNLSFITPTIMAGDRSLVSIICHELAHSWSGNLVTNATWDDFWLNEGFTIYFERRIDEEIYGKKEAEAQDVFGKQALEATVKEMGDTNPDTHLKTNYKDRDPDEATNDIAYEKGYFFLRAIENAVGRQKFDVFLKSWFDGHAFQSVTTEQFLAYLNEHLIRGNVELEKKIRIKDWVYGPGIPSNIVHVESSRFKNIDVLISAWKQNRNLSGFKDEIVTSNEKRYFITQLPSKLSTAEMAAIDKEFNFTGSNNTDVQLAWYTLAIRNNYAAADARIKTYLMENGRTWHIVPLYKEMMLLGKASKAREIYKEAKPNYHPVTSKTLEKVLQE